MRNVHLERVFSPRRVVRTLEVHGTATFSRVTGGSRSARLGGVTEPRLERPHQNLTERSGARATLPRLLAMPVAPGPAGRHLGRRRTSRLPPGPKFGCAPSDVITGRRGPPPPSTSREKLLARMDPESR